MNNFDLANLACGAAIELDNISLACGGERECVRDLVGWLYDHFPAGAVSVIGTGPTVCPSALVLLNRVATEITDDRFATVDQVVAWVRSVAAKLNRVNRDDWFQELAPLLTFCVQLSREAMNT